MSEEKMKLFHPNLITKQTKKTKVKKGGSKNGGQGKRNNNTSQGSGNKTGSKNSSRNSQDKAE